jgi:hypothetical protein
METYSYDIKKLSRYFEEADIKNDKLKLIEYFKKENININIYSQAAKIGNLQLLRFLHENGCSSWGKFTCEIAAENGHLGCLEYVHKNGSPWDNWTCFYAAKYNHIECLKYAHENGCDWDKNTCETAVKHGHLYCLMYACENGCPLDKESCLIVAIEKHNYHIISYINTLL